MIIINDVIISKNPCNVKESINISVNLEILESYPYDYPYDLEEKKGK